MAHPAHRLVFCANEGSWGPASDCRALDFTLLFQSTILSILPDAIAVVVFGALSSRAFLSDTAPRPRHASRVLYWLKIALSALLGAACVAAAVLFSSVDASPTYGPFPGYSVNLGAFVLSAVSTLPLLFLIHRLHGHTSAPSTFVLSYALSKTLFGAALLRSYAAIGLLDTPGDALGRALFALLLVRTVMYALVFAAEAVETPSSDQPKERTSSIITLPLFIWLLPTLYRGRTSRLTLHDLQHIPSDVTAVPARLRLERILRRHPQMSLLRASFRAFFSAWLSPVLPRALLVLATFGQPLLVNDILTFVAARTNADADSDAGAGGAPIQRGWAIVGGFICIYWLMWILTTVYYDKMYANTVQYRAALVSTIYAKILRLSPSVLTSLRGGAPDPAAAPSAPSSSTPTVDVSTLMSVDVERCVGCFEKLHECWAALLAAAVAVAILHAQIGYPAFLPLPIVAGTMGASAWNARGVRRQQGLWLGATDRRVKFVTSVVHRLLPIKWNLYGPIMKRKIAALRQTEMALAEKFYSVVTFTATLTHNAESMCLFAVLIAYAAAHQGVGLDSQTIFTVSTTVGLMSEAVGNFGNNTSQLLAAYASLKRIDDFLHLDEKQDADADADSERTTPGISISAPDPSSAPSLLYSPAHIPVSRSALTVSDGVPATPSSGSAGESRNGKDDEKVKEDEKFASGGMGIGNDGGGGFGGLALRGASFAWSARAEAFLKDINVVIKPGLLYVCVGPIASGKTMLLRSLIGETTLSAGTSTQLTQPQPRTSSDLPNAPSHPRCTATTAYAAQSAFLCAGTIRSNILFGRAHVPARYAATLRACALGPDLAGMALGDAAGVEEKGANFSGGQRQRIALARAVYADADITVLDDVFSALDGNTEKTVFQGLFGPSGLLRGRTVVLSTQNRRYIAAADTVLVLNGGTLAYQGSFDELRGRGLYAEFKESNAEEEGEEEEGERGALGAAGGEVGGEVQSVVVAEEGEKEVVVAVKASEPESESPTGSATGNGRPSADRRWGAYRFLGQMAGWRIVSTSMLIIVVWGSERYGSQGLLLHWSTAPSEQWRAYVGGYSGFIVAGMVLCAASVLYLTQRLIPRAALRIHAKEVEALLDAPPSFAMATPASKIVNRFSQDIFVVDFSLPLASLNISCQTCWFIAALVLTFLPIPWLTLSLLVLVPIYYMMFNFYLGTSTQLQGLEAESKSPLYGLFASVVEGLETVRTFGAQTYFQAEVDGKLDLSQGPYYHRYAGLRFLRAGLAAMAFAVAVALAILTVVLSSSTSAAVLGLALSNLTSLSTILSYALTSYADMENSIVSIERIHEITSIAPENDVASTPQEKEIDDTSLSGSDQSVVFEDVSVKYRADLPFALKNVSFHIQPGQKIGFCGRTGSGKSTVALALLQAFEPSLVQGQIFVNGANAKTSSIRALRSSLAVVTQEPFIWPDSIRANLDPAGDYDDAAVWVALEKVGLRSAVSALPAGLETTLEEESPLSRGQRQLLCLARVFLRNVQIIVLDEATSSLDSESAAQVQNALQAFLDPDDKGTSAKPKTVLVIAHRIASILDSDLIVVLDGGAIVESGDPRALLRDTNSRFWKLAETQGLVTTGS